MLFLARYRKIDNKFSTPFVLNPLKKKFSCSIFDYKIFRGDFL
jgi:hypothetical protein